MSTDEPVRPTPALPTRPTPAPAAPVPPAPAPATPVPATPVRATPVRASPASAVPASPAAGSTTPTATASTPQTASTPAVSERLLVVQDLVLQFGGVKALSDVSFEVGRGELFAVIGPNGAGKTSIFNCLNGVYRPSRGTITLEGIELVGKRPARIASLGIARTFQNLGLFTNLNVIDNLMLGRHHLMRSGFVAGALWWGRARREEAEHRVAVEQVIELLELQPYRYRHVGLLPYGIQKRIEMGRALAMDPQLLLLDEPVAGMNTTETEDMARYILEIRNQLKVSMILVEHDMHMVMDIADRVMALDFGVPLATGVPAQIQQDQRVIDAYLGKAS